MVECLYGPALLVAGGERENHSISSMSSLAFKSVRSAELLALPTLDRKVPGWNPTGDRIQLMTEWCSITQSLSLSLFHCHEMTQIMLKGT